MKTLVVGLGSMGFGAAVSCLRAGISTAGFDVNPEALQRFRANGCLLYTSDAADE